jgi:predicted membrane chloride channel (bestrophin family)
LYYFARYLVGQVWPGAQTLVTALLVFIIVVLLPRGIVGTLRLYLPPQGQGVVAMTLLKVEHVVKKFGG